MVRGTYFFNWLFFSRLGILTSDGSNERFCSSSSSRFLQVRRPKQRRIVWLLYRERALPGPSIRSPSFKTQALPSRIE